MLKRCDLLANEEIPLAPSTSIPSPATILQLGSHGNVSPAVLACLASTLSSNTWLGYRRDIDAFLRWGGTIPASPQMVAEYAAACATTLAPATIRRRIAGIAAAHARAALTDPTRSSLVRAVLRGIQRQAKHGQRRVAPILPAHLEAMLSFMDGILGDRDRALLLTGFAGALRRSELVAIDVEDLRFMPEGAFLKVRRSKTDQSAHGRTIFLPRSPRTTCPIHALDRWLARSGITQGPLFVSLERQGTVRGRRLSPQSVALALKRYAQLIGIDPGSVSGHSLRCGWITAAAAQGASDHELRQHSGHKTAEMVTRYIRMARSTETTRARSLL